MNNQITLAYLDYDDLDALQVVSVVSFYESFIDGADPLDMQGYLQTQLTTEILAVELAQSTSKFIGIKDHQILIGYMKVNDEKDAIEIQRLYLLSRAIIKCWFWAIEIVGSFLFIVSFLFLSFHYNFSFDRKVL